ncbi:MAG: MFS transporter [Saprospiraceae bacterium]|nr:MFS transporter [Saprospiraceae bacterium]
MKFKPNDFILVSTLFFVYGFSISNLVSRLPELQSIYKASNNQIGIIALSIAIGGVAAASALSRTFIRFQRKTLLIIAFAISSFLLTVSPLLRGEWGAFILFFIYGMTDGTKEVIVNEYAVSVEKKHKKPRMSSFYAVYSLSIFLGAITGWQFENYKIPLFNHLIIISFFCLLLIIWSFHHLSANIETLLLENETPTPSIANRKITLLLGGIAFCGMLGDSALNDWSSIYTVEMIKADKESAALSFASFTGGASLGRLIGDYLTSFLGKYRLLFWNGIVSIIGLSIVISTSHLYVAFIGFFAAGLGISTIVPLAYSVAGNTKGVYISKVAQIGYSAYFLAPPVIGALGDYFSLRVGYGFVLCWSICLIFLIKKLYLSHKFP